MRTAGDVGENTVDYIGSRQQVANQQMHRTVDA
jgi:hypothetical protein